MPHISVKLFPGRTEEQKQEFTAKVIDAAETVFGSTEASLSVSIREIAPDEWDSKVYDFEIATDEKSLYKRPGYGSLAAT